MHDFGPRLAAWRLSKGLTQAELALKAGIPRPNLSALEQSKRDITLQTLNKLVQALGLSVSQVLEKRPPAPFDQTDRHQIDAVARALVSGERPFSDAINQMVDRLAAIIKSRLQAHQVPGYRNVAHISSDGTQSWRVLQSWLGSSLIDRILGRVTKFLPHAA